MKNIYYRTGIFLLLLGMLSCESEKRFPPRGYLPNTPGETQQLEAAYFWVPQDKLNSRYWKEASYVKVSLENGAVRQLHADGKLNATGTYNGTSDFNGGKDPAATLKAGYDSEYLYILVEWKDTTADASYFSKLWQGPEDPLKSDTVNGWTSQRNQDNFSLLFGKADNSSEVWRWSLAYTAPFDMALQLGADANGEIDPLPESLMEVNAQGDSPREAPKYEWNGERQELMLDDGTLKVLDPAYYLHKEYKMEFKGDVAAGQSIFNSKADCRFCHGPNGNGNPDGSTNGGALDGIFLNRYSREGLIEYINSPGHEGRGLQYWGRIKNNPTEVENMIGFMRGIPGVPGHILGDVPDNPAIKASLNLSVGGIEAKNSTYRVLLRRKLDTGNPEDVSFDPSNVYPFSIRFSDNDALNYVGVGGLELTFKSNAL